MRTGRRASLAGIGVRAGLAPMAFLLVLAGCQRPAEPDVRREAPAIEPDLHSFARPELARVTHVALDLRADFDARVLSGQARLTVERAAGAGAVVLDSRDLAIDRVTDPSDQPLPFEIGPEDAVRGRAVTVSFPDNVREIVVSYRTSPGAAALQWLAPEQTAGGTRPYLYSQGQAILTRTWIPTQDSPGIRQTYSARIVVPRGLRAVMSAEALTPDGVEAGDDQAFEFRLTRPVPPYLIALAVGDIAFRQVGPRTGVFAEPSVVDAAAREFADLEQMVASAEALLGPYQWGRYDVLVLPPSFPFGGMENPRLTFATPTVLAGDRSLVSLIAHELAHSWSGNLVTNATWRDFWLNEGITSYVELRIMEALYSAERAAMLEVIGRRDLDDDVARLGGPTSPDTILHIDLAGRDPDAGMTQVPYGKGATLLRLIEQTAGREPFDAYLRSYFDRHAFQSITTAAFLADIRANLIRDDAALADRLRLDEWLYEPGIPANAPVPRSPALEAVAAGARAVAEGAPAASLDVAGWSTQQWQHFLAALPERLPGERLADLDRTFGLTGRGNSEVLFAWLRIAVRNQYEPALPALERFLTTQGRRKFLRPLYGDLMATDWGRPTATRIYAKARPLYHAVATTTLDAIVSSRGR